MQEEKLTFREKILKHRLTRIYRIVLGIVLVIAIIGVIRIQIDNRVYTDYEVIKTAESIGSSDSVVQVYGGNILCYSRDGISAYDSNGKQLWNQTYEMQSPIVDASGEYVVAGDYKGNTIYIMNRSGSCGQIDTNMVILNLSVSEKGVVTATLDGGDVIWLDIYSDQGENIVSVKTSMSQTGFPLKNSMSSDNQKMAVSYIKPAGNGIQTSLAFYNFGDVGQNVTDKIVSGYDYEDMVIPFLHYINENDAVAVGEDRLLVFSGKQIPELRAEAEIAENVESVFYGDSFVVLIYHNSEGEDKYKLELYDLSAEMLLSQTFNIEYSNVLISQGNIIIYNEAEVLIWNKKGLAKYSGELGGGIKALIPTDSKNKFVVVKNEGLEIIKLR